MVGAVIMNVLIRGGGEIANAGVINMLLLVFKDLKSFQVVLILYWCFYSEEDMVTF